MFRIPQLFLFATLLTNAPCWASDTLLCKSDLIATLHNGALTTFENRRFVLRVLHEDMIVQFEGDELLKDQKGNEVHIPLLLDNYPIPLDLYSNNENWWAHDFGSQLSFDKGELLYTYFSHTGMHTTSLSAFCELL